VSNDVEPRPENGRPPLHRRQYLVDRPFQFRLIGTLLAIWVAHSLFFALVLYLLFERHLTTFYEIAPRAGMEPLVSLGALYLLAVGFIVSFGFVTFWVVALYLSHRIAGPLRRTKQCLERVGRGDWNFTLEFREGDFLQDLPKIFESMVDGLKRLSEAEIEELRVIEASAGDPRELKRRVRRLRERKERRLGHASRPDGGRGREPEPVSLFVH
jgi:hypothetical protein